ncbi:hypothetical protein [Psychrobacter sp. I-STPA6b]|uniref:hypothetical protein n=1 Tax=Psychrobacter sp. I-STPA6b TaxID=2585718 RepID=UPI001D0CBBF7|nr:hypothetical protein [Psychrobacter sp. I-STPA6b]
MLLEEKMSTLFFDNDTEAADCHVDKHVGKMIRESVQLLSTTHRVLDVDDLDEQRQDKLYRKTHSNQPSAVWVRESSEHYNWSYSLFLSLVE